MKKLIKRYRIFIITFTAMLLFTIFNQELGSKAFNITLNSIFEMLLVIPPIFILLGLLDVWVPREMIVKYMGEGSGIKGILLSIFIGSAAAGPLYGAFPVAAVFMKKGVTLMNILIFIGAWSTTKIPMFLFEISALGERFAISRLLIDIPGIIVIAFILSKLVSKKEVDILYKKAQQEE